MLVCFGLPTRGRSLILTRFLGKDAPHHDPQKFVFWLKRTMPVNPVLACARFKCVWMSRVAYFAVLSGFPPSLPVRLFGSILLFFRGFLGLDGALATLFANAWKEITEC